MLSPNACAPATAQGFDERCILSDHTHTCRRITHRSNSTLVAALASAHSEGSGRRLLHTLRKARQHPCNVLASRAANSAEILPGRASAIQTIDAMVSQVRWRIIEAEVADSVRNQRRRTPRSPAHRKRGGKERVSCSAAVQNAGDVEPRRQYSERTL